MQKKLSLLWIVPKSSVPPDDGAKVASYSLLKGLIELGCSIDLLCIYPAQESFNVEALRNAFSLRNIYAMQRKKLSLLSKIISLLNPFSLPTTVVPFSHPDITHAIHSLLASHNASCDGFTTIDCSTPGVFDWNYIVYDGMHLAAHATQNRVYTKNTALPVLYRAHNCESEIWYRKANNLSIRKEKHSFLKRISLLFISRITRLLFLKQAKKIERFEQSLCVASDKIFTVSDEDQQFFLSKTVPKAHQQLTKEKFRTVPIGYAFSEIKKNFNNSSLLNILFIGRLDWPPNKEGLIWFLENVWNTVTLKRHDIQLTIAGSGDSEWLKRYLPNPSIDFRGKVKEVSEVYDNTLLSIVPVFYGAGTRVKVIEACRFRKAILGTAIGVEGVGLRPEESYLNAETKEEWQGILLSVNKEGLIALGERGFNVVKERFEYKNCAGKFLDGL
jgi:polysaccharide biosynthesis protein PslH